MALVTAVDHKETIDCHLMKTHVQSMTVTAIIFASPLLTTIKMAVGSDLTSCLLFINTVIFSHIVMFNVDS